MFDVEKISKTVRVYEDGEMHTASNGRIGRYIFFPRAIEEHFTPVLPKSLTILDIGCGAAADHPLLKGYFDKKGIDTTLVGVDVNISLLHMTRDGLVTYPLEIDLEVDEEGITSISERVCSYTFRHRALIGWSLFDYFIKYNPSDSEIYHHIDAEMNPESGRWVMNQDFRTKLRFIEADAIALPFMDETFDVVIAENFLLGGSGGVYDRIRSEMFRVKRHSGLLLDEGKKKI